jgi:hypothetical protein
VAGERTGTVEVGQVWASNHRGDRDRGERQERHVVDVDHRYAWLLTPGQKTPTRVLLRVPGSRSTVKNYRLVRDVPAGGEQDGA